MIRDLGPFNPRRPHKLNAPLLTMLLNGVHDRHAGRVFVLQIGAGTGQGGIGLLQRFGEDRWSGLLIEPHPDHFAALEALHAESDRVAVLNLGISNVAASVALHSVAPEALARDPRLSGGRASVVRDRLMDPRLSDEDIVSVDIPVLRLDSVLGELGIDSAHLVTINAGGHEPQILDSFDLAALAPSLMLVAAEAGSDAEAACVVALTDASFLPFRIGGWLVGLAPGALSVPLEELLTFMQKGVDQTEDAE